MESSNDIFVIDDIVSKDYQRWIEQIIIDQPDLPWYYRKNAIVANRQKDLRNVSCLFHFLYQEDTKVSPLFDALYPIVLNINEKEPSIKWDILDRMRINLMPKMRDSELLWHHPHIDNYYQDGWNAIYYVNTPERISDGDTFIFDQCMEQFTPEENDKILNDNYFTVKKKISPKRGRIVIFRSKYYHASSWCNSIDRYVININLVNGVKE